MRILIVEDDLASRKFLYKFLSDYADCDITVDGIEAVEAFMLAWDEDKPYDLVCLDVMMPKLDGIKTLKAIRDIEKQKEVGDRKAKIIMTTAINDAQSVHEAFEIGCEGYAAKPIDTQKFIEVMKKLNLME